MLAACRGWIPHGSVDSDLAILIPPDTQMLAGIRFDRLRATPLYRKLAAENMLPAFFEFRAGSGFDPARDLHEVLLASDGKQTLAIARGTFPAKLSGDDGERAIVVLDHGRALAGPPVLVRAAIDRYRSGHRAAPRDLLARAEALPDDAQIWAVVLAWHGLSPGTLRNMGNAANLDRILREVESATLTADLRSGVRVAFAGDCRTAQDAKTLSEQLRGLLSLLRANVPKNRPDIQRAAASIQVSQSARTAKVNLDLPQDLTDKLADELLH